MNEVFALHYDGELLSKLGGNRKGAVYCLRADASRRRTRIVKDWKKYRQSGDPEKLTIVRYVPGVQL